MVEALVRIPQVKTIIKESKTYQYDDATFTHQKKWNHVPTKHLDTFYPFNIITVDIFDPE